MSMSSPERYIQQHRNGRSRDRNDYVTAQVKHADTGIQECPKPKCYYGQAAWGAELAAILSLSQ